MSVSDDELAVRFSTALAAAGDVAYSWDLDGDRLDWTGRLAAELATGRNFANRIHPEDLVQRQLALAEHFDEEAAFDCEYRLRDAAGGFVWVHERGQATRDSVGRPLLMLGVIRGIGDRKAQQTRLERLANFDELTGHFNKSRLREAVDQIIAANQRTGSPAAFLSVGIDSMTMINDMFGYAAAEKILAAVNSTPVTTARGPIYATASIGSTAFPDQGLTSYDVITRAESALGEAKRAGRDCHSHYRMTGEQRERQRRSLTISEQVRAALREERVLFAFQPVVVAETEEVDHYECLLRMRTPSGRIVPASEFVPVIEQLGFIRLIDRYVLDKVVEELAAHPEVRLGFNISGLTAADRPWLRALVM